MFLTSLFITLPQHNDRPYILELDLPPTNNISPYPVYITHFSSSCCHYSSRKTVSFPFPLMNRSVNPGVDQKRGVQCISSACAQCYARMRMRNFRLHTILCVDVALDEVRRCIHTCRSSQESDPLCEKKSLRPWIGTYISRCRLYT